MKLIIMVDGEDEVEIDNINQFSYNHKKLRVYQEVAKKTLRVTTFEPVAIFKAIKPE